MNSEIDRVRIRSRLEGRNDAFIEVNKEALRALLTIRIALVNEGASEHQIAVLDLTSEDYRQRQAARFKDMQRELEALDASAT